VLPAFNKHGPLGLVLVAQPLLMLDLGGGCCRPPPPLPFHSEEPVRPEDPHTQWLAERGVHFTRIVREAGQQPEHEWLLLACHCHSSTYYHAVAEAAPKIIWAMPLLRSNPNLKVLHDSTHVSDVLELLKLPKRGLMQCSRGAFARRLTIPPAPLLSRGLLSAFRDELWRSAALTAPPKSKRKPRVVVVRRSPMGAGGGRSLLNHDELMFTLRHVLLPSQVELLEWPPDASVKQAAALPTFSSCRPPRLWSRLQRRGSWGWSITGWRRCLGSGMRGAPTRATLKPSSTRWGSSSDRLTGRATRPSAST